MFLWTSQWRLIQRTHWIFQPSPHSHQAVDLFFSSSWCFFKHVKQTHVPFPSPNRQALHVGLSPGWHQLCFLTFLVVFSKEFKDRSDLPLCSPDVLSSWRVKCVGKTAWEACLAAAWAVFFLKKHVFAAMSLEILFTLALCCVSFFLKNMTLAEFPCCLG